MQQYSPLTLRPQNPAPATPDAGLSLYADSAGLLSWRGANGFVRTFDGSALTANRSYGLPDKAGTVALLSDAPGRIAFYLTAANTNASLGVKPGFPMLYNATLTNVWVTGNPGPVGANFICELRQAGTNILSTPVSIDAGEVSSLTAATPPVISTSTLTKGSWIDANITQIGATPGQNYVMVLEVTPT